MPPPTSTRPPGANPTQFNLLSDFTIKTVIENPHKFDNSTVAMALELREFRRTYGPLGCEWLAIEHAAKAED